MLLLLTSRWLAQFCQTVYYGLSSQKSKSFALVPVVRLPFDSQVPFPCFLFGEVRNHLTLLPGGASKN